jgi:hypothetical protein
MSEHIDVFLPEHETGSPFLSLWTDDAVVFFFTSILADQVFFPDEKPFLLARFQPESALHTGTGRYVKRHGTIQVEQETGSLVGLLSSVGVSFITEQTTVPIPITEELSQSGPTLADQEPLPRERTAAEEKARRLEAVFAELHLQHDPIDWQQVGMLAFVIVNGVVVGDLVTLADEPERVLRQARHQLMADVAFKHLGIERDGHLIRLRPVEPVPAETTYVAFVYIDEEIGVPVAEYLRDGKRVYEYYPALQEEHYDDEEEADV